MRVHGEFQSHLSPREGRADRHPGSTVGLREESGGFSEKSSFENDIQSLIFTLNGIYS